MAGKFPPRPDLIRRVPHGFGWIDHRFVREGHIRHLSRESLVLYLFLVTVANEEGISWYSTEKLCLLSGLDSSSLSLAREQLTSLSLLAYSPPVYQVLELPSFMQQNLGTDLSTLRNKSMTQSQNQYKRLEGTFGIGDIITMLEKGAN